MLLDTKQLSKLKSLQNNHFWLALHLYLLAFIKFVKIYHTYTGWFVIVHITNNLHFVACITANNCCTCCQRFCTSIWKKIQDSREICYNQNMFRPFDLNVQRCWRQILSFWPHWKFNWHTYSLLKIKLSILLFKHKLSIWLKVYGTKNNITYGQECFLMYFNQQG